MMGKTKRSLLVVLTVTWIILTIVGTSEAGFEGTIGTRFTISGSGFGTKKPSVYLEYEKTPGTLQKVTAKVENWNDSSLTCLWTKKLPPGIYNLFVQPKAKVIAPIPVGTFTIMNPAIYELAPNTGSFGDKITINGQFFSTKKPQVSLEDPTTLEIISCKVVNFSMNPDNGQSLVEFIVPKGGMDNRTLILKNAIGEVRRRIGAPIQSYDTYTDADGIANFGIFNLDKRVLPVSLRRSRPGPHKE